MSTKTTFKSKNVWYRIFGKIQKGDIVKIQSTMSHSEYIGKVERVENATGVNNRMDLKENIVIVLCSDGVSRWFYISNVEEILS